MISEAQSQQHDSRFKGNSLFGGPRDRDAVSTAQALVPLLVSPQDKKYITWTLKCHKLPSS